MRTIYLIAWRAYFPNDEMHIPSDVYCFLLDYITYMALVVSGAHFPFYVAPSDPYY